MIKKIAIAAFGATIMIALSWHFTLQPTQQADKRHTAADNVQPLVNLEIEGLQRNRAIRIYLPPSYGVTDKRYPVLYMHDGQNLFDEFSSYSGEWGVDEALNTLARSHQLELIVVGIDNGGEHRITELNPWDHAEYGKSEAKLYLDFIVNKVKPYIDQRFNTLADRDNTGLMGSSLGGLSSHYAALQYSSTFSKAGIFSPSYWIAPDISEFLRQHPIDSPQRLFFLMGEAEGGDMLSGFVAVREQLKAQNAANPNAELLFATVAHGQHHETQWRSQFAAAVLWLFQPPASVTLAPN